MPSSPHRLPAVAMDGIQFLVRMLSDQQLHCVLHFAGPLDAERMERAVRATIDAEPVLGCRLVEGPRWPHWEPVDGLDAENFCPVIPTADPGAAALEGLVKPMQWETGPQVRVRLLRGTDGDALCISMGHAVADGGGLIEYAMLLAATYRALEKGGFLPPPAQRSLSELRAARGLGQVIRRFSWPARLWSLHQASMPPPAWRVAIDAGTGVGGDAAPPEARTVVVRQLSADAMTALRAWTHAHTVSFNDLLLTAFFRALCAVLEPPAGILLPVQIPVNLRRYLPGGRAGAIANLSGSAFPTLEHIPGEPFERAVVRTHAALINAGAPIPGVGQAISLHTASAIPWCIVKPYSEHRMTRMQQDRLVPILSNMGELDPRWVDMGGPPLTGVFGVGPVIYPPGLLVAASTFNGVLTLASATCETATTLSMVERCLTGTLAELRAVASL